MKKMKKGVPQRKEGISQIKRISRKREGTLDKRQKTAISGTANLRDGHRKLAGGLKNV